MTNLQNGNRLHSEFLATFFFYGKKRRSSSRKGSPSSRLHKSSAQINTGFYNAGSWRFVGLFRHEAPVSEDILGNLAPQCLQIYCDFSAPSYSSCLFVGLFKHDAPVSEDTLGNFAPQCLQ